MCCHGLEGTLYGIKRFSSVRVLLLLATFARFARVLYIRVDLHPVDAFTCESSCLFDPLVTTVQLLENVLLHRWWYQDMSSFEDDTCFHG